MTFFPLGRSSWLAIQLGWIGITFAMLLCSSVAWAETVEWSPTGLPNGVIGKPYSQTVSAFDDSVNDDIYTYSITSGSLPPGLTFGSTTGLFAPGATSVLISGAPTTAGVYTFSIHADSSDGDSGDVTLSITISQAMAISPASLPAGTQGVSYSQTISTSGGNPAYTYSIYQGSLPPGLTLGAASGVISGTPTTGGTYSFTVQSADQVGYTATQAYSVSIGTNSLTLNPPSLPNGTRGTAYTQTVSATGGTAPYTFAVASGSLPAGLSLNAGTGVVSGTPTGSGASTFTVQVTDAAGNIGTRSYTVNIGTNVLTVNPSTLPVGTPGLPYSQTVSAVGGTGPYTFAVSSGSLPAGLALNGTTGAITGTPTGRGSSFTVVATDSLGNAGSRTYTLNIGTNSLMVNPPTLPAAPIGKPFSQTITATGGTAPYSFAIIAGALPPGLLFNPATGVISGTPTTTAVSSFTIQALDVNGNVGTRAYTLINRGDPAADPEVQGLINAQVAATRRFASAQTENVTRHLEGLHDRFDPCGVDIGISMPRSDTTNPPFAGAFPYYQSPAAAGRYYEPDSAAAQVARRSPAMEECAASSNWIPSSFAFWVSGALQFGSVTPTGLVTTSSFSTTGLTAGVDWHLFDKLIVGIAAGYGSDRTDVGVNGTRNDASGISALLYASVKVLDPWFIDAVVGYGSLGNDARRWVSDSSVLVNGTRGGSSWFGSLGTSWEFRNGALKVVPFVRGDFVAGQLNGFSEQGPSPELLTYGATSFNSISGTVGLRGSYDIPVSWGTLSPMARVEYRYALDDSFDQPMYYSDLGPGLTSVMSQPSATRSAVNAGAGFRARIIGGASAELEYVTTSAGAAFQSQSIRALLRLPF